MPGLATAATKAVERFMSVMVRLRERVGGPRLRRRPPARDPRARPATSTALEAERTIEAEGRLENLEELVGRRARVRRHAPRSPSLEEFLQQIALFSEQDALQDDEGIVTLMTLHNAKGLEYPVVFIIGCEDGVFPHMRAIEAGDLEEERRLCYVGRHPSARASSTLLRAHARAVRLARVEPAVALHRRDPRGAHRPRGGGARDAVGAALAAPEPRPAPRSPWATTSSTPTSATAW